MARIYREHYFDTCTKSTVLLPGVVESLDLLGDRNLRLAIATSKSCRGSEIILDDLGIRGHFEFVVGADSVSRHKPDPEALLLSMSHLAVDADQMIYVGDTKYDTQASRNAGVNCVAVATGYASREELAGLDASYVADTLLEAANYIIRSYA